MTAKHAREEVPDSSIRVTVPQEFAAVVLREINARQGQVTEMSAKSDGRGVIRAILRSGDVESFVEAVTAATLGDSHIETE